MIDNKKAHSAVSTHPNLKEVYSSNSLKPTFDRRRKFSKIRKALKKRQKS